MIVRNYSDLTPAMRDAITGAHRVAKRHAATWNALVRRGFAATYENGFILTEAGERARRDLLSNATPVPEKVADRLERAEKLGLETFESEPSGTLRSWTVSSPNSNDTTQLWIYWSPGARGGRVGFTVYYGTSTRTKRNVTSRYAWITMQEMGESLQRHQSREAARAEAAAVATADVRHGVELVAGNAEPKLEQCGCPTQIVTAEGHQPGCPVDPSRPGWFVVDQHIYDHGCNTWFRVGIVQSSRAGGVDAVAVSVNGGYGRRLVWYGNHPEAVAPLSSLESRCIGLTDAQRRPWPRTDRAAAAGIRQTLTDQKLSGWAVGAAAGPAVVINIPDGTDPERHLTLLRRYVPYFATVELRNNGLPRNHYPTIYVTPREV